MMKKKKHFPLPGEKRGRPATADAVPVPGVGHPGKRAGSSVSPRSHKAAHDPRAAALTALSRVFREGVDSQAALEDALSSPELMPTDKRLCTELLYGVLRWYLRLDWFVRRFLQEPDKLPEEMRLCLLSALYEMVFLRVPHHATVNWTVSHVGNRFSKGLAAVANGVLRSMQRDLHSFSSPDTLRENCASSEEILAREYAMPLWIVRQWREQYGQEGCLELLRAAQAVPPSGLRLNRACPGWESARADLLRDGAGKVLPVGPAGLAFFGPLPWQARELVQQGMASRQSSASYEALEFFAPACWPLPLWDCCAGRGGKTLSLLEQGIPVALASDSSARRLQGLGREYARLGLDKAGGPGCPVILPLPAETIAANTPGEPGNSEGSSLVAALHKLPASFGAIVLDAPCSGLGTLSRRPEIRLRRTPEDVARLVALQRSILDAVWQRLRTGGFLVYLTCTLQPEENEGQISNFFAAHVDALLRREFQTSFSSPLREFFYGALLEKR